MFHVAFRLGFIPFGTHECDYVVQVVADDGIAKVRPQEQSVVKETVRCFMWRFVWV